MVTLNHSQPWHSALSRRSPKNPSTKSWRLATPAKHYERLAISPRATPSDFNTFHQHHAIQGVGGHGHGGAHRQLARNNSQRTTLFPDACAGRTTAPFRQPRLRYIRAMTCKDRLQPLKRPPHKVCLTMAIPRQE